MLLIVISRIAQTCAMILIMSVVVFCAVFAIGNPMDLFANEQMTQQQIAETAARMGLDRPLWAQYVLFVQNVLSGDFGTSFVFGISAFRVVLQRLPATMELAFAAIVIAVSVGIPLGLWVGLRAGGRIDRAVMSATALCFSVPTFWAGLLLIMLFSIQLRIFPTGGRGQTVDLLGVPLSFLTRDGLLHLFLPAVNLSLPVLALILRLTRAGVIENLRLDYIRFARAKGLTDLRIVSVHLLGNIIVPIVTVVGLQLGTLIAFAVVTETVFSWPGIGKLIVDSITLLDRPVIIAHLILVVMIFSFINLAGDLLYAALDPRVRHGEAGR